MMAKTKTIKLMPAAIIRSWNDPLRAVEKMSMLGSLSEVRVALGMGYASLVKELPMGESRQLRSLERINHG